MPFMMWVRSIEEICSIAYKRFQGVVLCSHFRSIRFKNYKALKKFYLPLSEFNVLVGPNNAGKSTIIGAFRLLSEGLRKARSKSAEYVPTLKTFAYHIPLKDTPIA